MKDNLVNGFFVSISLLYQLSLGEALWKELFQLKGSS